MDLGRPSLRLLGVLLVVTLPPLVVFATVASIAPDLVARYGAGTVLLAVTVLALGWSVVVAIVGARLLGGELRSMLELTERGPVAADEGDGAPSEALRRAGAALEERNRQISLLARSAREAAITKGPTAVASHVVATTVAVTGDPTWSLAVLLASDTELLPPGVYAAEPGEATPLLEVHRWAAVTGDAAVRQVEGPWGAFLVVDVASGDDLRAVLISPREGRPEPSAAALDMLTVLAEHAATAIEHAILYRRVAEQAGELERLGEVQRDFLRGVTHDLQTPLTSIRALADELCATATDGTARTDLETISYQADRLRRMVGQLLAASRLEAGALQPSQEVFRPEPIIRRAWEALRSDRPFSVTTEGAPHLLVADPDRFEQVMWALLDNAVKYSQPGSPVAVTIGSLEEGAGIRSRVAVSDHGAGMSEGEQQRAFEQFFRADAARRLAPDGSGIGLHAARGLVRAMSGEASLTSRPGFGTTVTLELPAETSDEQDERTMRGR